MVRRVRMIALVLTLAGILGLTVFAAFIWLPLALGVLSVSALAAGLFVDWEALSESSPTPDRG